MSSSEKESVESTSSEAEAENSEGPALDASDTELDEDADNDTETHTKSKAELLTEDLLKKYEERAGKQLYIRFPHKLPEEQTEFEEKVHALSPLIVKAHKPRQKHARFCLVDFNSKTDRDAALKSIKAVSKQTPNYKVVASIPRTENAEFVKELAERKLRTLENKKAKARLRRASKLAMHCKNYTSSIVVLNLPKSSTITEVRKLFPKAVDIQIKAAKGKMNATSVAAITLPSTLEARAAIKQKYSLDGTALVVRFDTQRLKKHSKGRKRSANKDELKAGTIIKANEETTAPPAKQAKVDGKQKKQLPVVDKAKVNGKTLGTKKPVKSKMKSK